MTKWYGSWICEPEFMKLKPVSCFHKELETFEEEEHDQDLLNRHTLFRKQFCVEEEIEEAYLNISGDDYYKCYINGHFVGQGPAPSYHFAYNYNQFKINEFLQQGDNLIAVHVYYQGEINRVWNSGDYRQGLIADLVINDKLAIATDSSWKYSVSKAYTSLGLTGYKTQYLEQVDGRLWDPLWNTLNYDDSSWEEAMVNLNDDHQIIEEGTKSLQVYNRTCEKFEKLDDGHYFIDFGQELTGQFTCRLKGKSGEEVEVRCGEELLDGSANEVRYKMRCNCDYQDLWILSGEEEDLEFFDYKAFRYVEVIGPKSLEIIGDFKATVRHYPFDDDLYKFESSNTMINQIVNVCKNGVKYGTQEVFVDCPTREKGQYLGDFTITGHSHIYLSGSCDMYRKTLRDFANSSLICPGLMAVAPGNYMQEIGDFSLQWPLQIYQYYMQTGDKDLLVELYETMVGLEQYFKNYEREDGLLVNVTEKWNLVDWPDNLRDDYDFELSKPIGEGCHNVINAHYYGMKLYAEKIREIIGLKPHHDLGSFVKTFDNVFYNDKTSLFIDCEGSSHSAAHSNALPMFYGMFLHEDKQVAIDLLKNKVQHCGVYMSYFVLKALCMEGEYDAVFKLIESLWSTMVNEGATTCYEAWGKDQKFNTSLCHPWASAPISILVEDIMGLKPKMPGWEEVSFKPNIPENLEYLNAQIPIKTGIVHVIKDKDGVRFKLL